MGNLGVTQIDSVRVKQQQKQKQQPAQTNQQSVSFFDEAWSGHQIAKLTGDNVFTDWLQNKDKVCTDDKDDGKLSVGQYALSFAKGLIGGIPKAIINHPVATAITAGLGAGAVALTGGAILPVLTAVGIVAGVGMIGYGTYKAVTAKKDGDAKQALETMGMGVTTTALSVASADKALEKAAEAGVKSAQVSKDANIFQKTVQIFKAIPEALTKSKEWTSYKLFGTAITVERPNGTTQVLEKGNLVKETLADGTKRYYDNGIIKEETLANGTKRYYDNGIIKEETLANGTKRYYENGIIKEETLTDGTYREYSSETPGRVITEKLPDGTLIDRYVKYDGKKGDFTKTTYKDGTYQVVDNNTGKILEGKFADGRRIVHHTSFEHITEYFPDGSRITKYKGITVYEQFANGDYNDYNIKGILTETKVGNKTSFFEDGKLLSSKEELPNGGYKYYDANGAFTEGKIVEGNKTSVFENRELVKEIFADGGYKKYDKGIIIEQKTGEEVARDLEFAKAAAKTAREARAYASSLSSGSSSSSSESLPNGATPSMHIKDLLTGEVTSYYDVEDCPSYTTRQLYESFGYNFVHR